MSKSRKNVVFGEGNPDAKLVLVGEAPGANEDSAGKPFQGDCGKWLDSELLPLLRLTRFDIFITNACKCRPIDSAGKNRKPRTSERNACKPFLLEELKIIEPEYVVLLGAAPLKSFFGYKARMKDHHGRWVHYDEIPLFPTYHPSRLNYQGKHFIMEDIKKLSASF